MAAASTAGAAEADDASPTSRYAIGVAAVSAPEYAGSDRHETKLQLLWAYQYGRLRITSSSRAGAALSFASDVPVAGVSADLVSSDRLRLGIGLRIDRGRRSSDSPRLAGLPDIRRTLRGRLYASYAFSPGWSVGASIAQDLLGHDGGATAGLDVGYRHRLGTRAEWTAGTGIALGDRRHMNTWFGVTDAQASRSGLAAFEPGAGLKDVHAGIGLTVGLTPHWIAFASAGRSRLLGDAAASPLTRSATGTSATIGLAYRSSR